MAYARIFSKAALPSRKLRRRIILRTVAQVLCTASVHTTRPAGGFLLQAILPLVGLARVVKPGLCCAVDQLIRLLASTETNASETRLLPNRCEGASNTGLAWFLTEIHKLQAGLLPGQRKFETVSQELRNSAHAIGMLSDFAE